MSDSTVALMLLFVVGIFSGMFLTNINVLLLTQVPDELRGRMMSTWGMVWGLLPLTTLIGGSIAEYFGITVVLVAAGTLVALTCAFMLLTRSPLLDL